MTDKTELVVTQADWRKIALAAGKHGVRYRTNSALLQFFADIGLATRTPDPTPVAWMYSRNGKVRIDHSPTHCDDMSSGWIATPIYAHPPAVPADGLVEALCHIKDETQRRQLPLTSLINDIATQALAAHRGEA